MIRKLMFWILLVVAAPAMADEQNLLELRIDDVVVVVEENTLYFCSAMVSNEQQCAYRWTPEAYIEASFGRGAIVRGVLPSLNPEGRPDDGIVIYYQESQG